MDKSKVNTRKKGLSFQSTSILIVVAIVVFVLIFGLYQPWFEKPFEESVHLKDYEALLLRAKVLTDKYKDLSAGKSVPPIAVANPDLGHLRSSYVRSTNAIEKSDLILGMAQDTDPKNLVRIPPLIQQVTVQFSI